MNTGFLKGVLKWFLCCASICIGYYYLDNVGILFAVWLDYVILKYL